MRKMFRQKMFQRFLISYFFVLILPLMAIGIILMNYNSQVLTEKARESSYQSLIQANLLADREFSELREIAVQIGRNQDIRKIMFEQNDVEWQYARWHAKDDMIRTNAFEQFPEEILVYFERTKEFLNATFYDSDLFYQKYPIDGMGADEFVQLVSANELTFSNITINNNTKKYLLYSSSIPISEGSSSGAVLMFIDWEKLDSLFSSSIGIGIEKYDFIVGLDNQLLYTSDPEGHLYIDELLQSLDNGDGLAERYIRGEKYLVAFISSDVMPLRYISVTAMEDVLSSVGAMQLNYAITMGVCILFGIVFIYYLMQRNYRPIQNLLDYVESGDRKKYRQTYDELGQIVEKLDTLFSENRLLEQSVQRQVPNLRQSFIGNLLSGRYTDRESILPLEEMLDIHFESDQFCVVITSVENYKNFTPEQNEKNLSLVNFALTNVFLEMMGEIALVLDVQMRRQKTFLLCFHDNCEDSQRKLEENLNRFHDVITRILNIQLSVGVSGVCSGISAIPRCNEEAKIALNQQLLYGYGSVSMYKIDDWLDGNRYYYPIDEETKLINKMLQGDVQGANEIVNHLFEENISSRHLPLQLTYCMVFNMLGTILKVLNEIGLEYDISGLVEQMLDAMLRQGAIRQLYQQILDAIGNICRQIQMSRESGNIQLKNRIAQYLEENYMDSNLSLLWVADQFHLSSPYLSRYFKDQMGMNFADYLCRLRITRAKELMKDDALSISDISSKVGYNSSNSFIRTFKRYESITPGQYRELLHK